MKIKTIIARNSYEFEKLMNEFLDKNKSSVTKITYNTVSDDGFIVFVAYIEME